MTYKIGLAIASVYEIVVLSSETESLQQNPNSNIHICRLQYSEYIMRKNQYTQIYQSSFIASQFVSTLTHYKK